MTFCTISGSALAKFSMGRIGRLDIEPLSKMSYPSSEMCAQACLDLSPEQCISFNYDFDDFNESPACELLGEIEGPDTSLHEVNTNVP